ncbi:MAG: M23 family metallopeptidase [Tenericutes bacterium]|nr:M23 family metallopeptidase [Mycoplasmatota bacterium]
MTKKTIFMIILSFLLSCFLTFSNFKETKDIPKEVYRVYLNGNSIGLIKSKSQLEKYIDNEQDRIKEQYDVNKVYVPKNLNIQKEITYNESISSISDIYEKIKDTEPFTINGYKITISAVDKDQDDKIINVLNKKIFEDSVQNTVKAFIEEENYEKFANNTQEEIKDVGTIIENIYIENNITIKEDRIAVNDKIYLSVDELSQYLLFGENTNKSFYTVKPGDNLLEIAFNNKMAVEELLVANTNLKSANALLYPGQQITVGMLSTAFNIVEEIHVEEYQDIEFKTEIEYDTSVYMGYSTVKQAGSNGLNKITKKIQKINGNINSAIITENIEITPAVNRIVVKGSTSNIKLGDTGYWAWPTDPSYIISDYYDWRDGRFHSAIDICCTGYGSPIYAANNGTVIIAETSPSKSTFGKYIVIDHNNGYYTLYSHLVGLNVKIGSVVTIGQRIGSMGNTGYVIPAPTKDDPTAGTHLHFEIRRGLTYETSSSLNPLDFY